MDADADLIAPHARDLRAPRVDPLVAIQRAFASSQVDPALGIVVAFSGGPDSLSLAACLARWQVNGGCGVVTLAHANHRWPGLEEHDDRVAKRCVELANALHLPLVNARVVPESEDAAQTNLEAKSREARYRFLAQVVADAGAACLVTGHTADDQAETVLARVIRGAGLAGLRGIARLWSRPPLVFRPALDLTRTQLHAALPPGLEPVDDHANHDESFTRVRIRRELLPILETFNPQIATALRRLADAAAALPDSPPSTSPPPESSEAAGSLTIDRAVLMSHGRAEAKGWLDAALAGWDEAALGAGAFERIWEFAHTRGAGRQVQVRAGLVVVDAGLQVRFVRSRSAVGRSD